MVTPYTSYGTSTASGIVGTCNTLVASTGAGAVTKTTLIGTATGYGEIWSQGNAGAWPAAGSLGGVGPHGWLSGTELEGNTLIGGNFTPSYTFLVSAGSITTIATVSKTTATGNPYFLRVRLFNTGPATIQSRIWLPGTLEPTNWDINTTS